MTMRASGMVVGLAALGLAGACGAGDEPLDGTSATSTTGSGGGGSVASSASAGSGETSSASTSTSSTGGGGVIFEPDAFLADASGAVCGALFRCCDAGSVRDFFAPLADEPRFEGFVAKLPPNATIASESECGALLAEMFAVAPFGDWLAQVSAGKVGYDPAAFEACVGELGSAACGSPVTAALYDGTCFGIAAPAGGSAQRSMFERVDGAGASCVPIKDGVGASFYGTCDPNEAFCCYDDPTKPGACGFPFEADGTPRVGTCKTASAVGGACEALKDIQLCKTGDTCDSSTGKCVASKTGALGAGQLCIDSSYNLLGDCEDSFCDVLGSKKCEPLKTEGQSCNGHDQCESGSCEGYACTPLSFCKG